MATVVNFAGKKRIEPGSYAQVLSGIPAQPSNFSFGNVMIIDTGKGTGWGGGSGINGSLAEGLKSVYSFDDLDDFRSFVRGGLFWDLSYLLFEPATGSNGPETVYYARACTTTPAEIDFTFVGGGANGGFVRFICKNEGLVGNGYLDEILATGKIAVNAPVTIGDTVEVEVDEGSGAAPISDVVTATTTSASDLRAAIIDSINGHAAGYSAREQGGEIILTARRRSGIDPNAGNWTITTNLTGTVTTTITPFSGGVAGNMLSLGYGAQMRAGDDDPTKFIIDFYEGQYVGATPGGNHYNGLSPQQTPPDLVASSIEFDNIDDLIQWAKSDFQFSTRFLLEENWVINGDGSVDAADLANYNDMELASNGTETYGASDLDDLLAEIGELDNTFFLCDRSEGEATGIENNKILDHVSNDSEFKKFLIIGGGRDETAFEGSPDSSIEIAKFYDDAKVAVVHSGMFRNNVGTSGNERVGSIYHATNFLGRLGGLEPQVPATFKNLRIQNFLHELNQKQREKALQAGVVHNRLVPNIGRVVNQSINTLQRNTQLINPDGTSFEISIMRIAFQLNKELVLNTRPLFVGQNAATASPADVKAFIERYLFSVTATDQEDGLILGFEKVTVKLKGDSYDIKYGFYPNGPVNKLFMTGFMLDPNLSA